MDPLPPVGCQPSPRHSAKENPAPGGNKALGAQPVVLRPRRRTHGDIKNGAEDRKAVSIQNLDFALKISGRGSKPSAAEVPVSKEVCLYSLLALTPRHARNNDVHVSVWGAEPGQQDPRCSQHPEPPRDTQHSHGRAQRCQGWGGGFYCLPDPRGPPGQRRQNRCPAGITVGTSPVGSAAPGQGLGAGAAGGSQ